MNPQCNEADVEIKSYFLGPKSENQAWFKGRVGSVLDHWFKWREQIFRADGRSISENDKNSQAYQMRQNHIEEKLDELLTKLEKETATFSPRYIGHMVSDLSLPAILGHLSCLLHNPNMTTDDVSRVGSALESEGIEMLGDMIGYDPSKCYGHFCSGGTVANIESMWRARYRIDHWMALGCYLNLFEKLDLSFFDAAHMGWIAYKEYISKFKIDEKKLSSYSWVHNGVWAVSKFYKEAFGHDFIGPVVIVPDNKHFSWQKSASLLGLGDKALVSVKLDENGRMDMQDLQLKIKLCKEENRPILMIVSVAGTTELGVFDPLDEIFEIANADDKIWMHVDAAYGGYYASLKDSSYNALNIASVKALKAIYKYDSVTLDPHKLGYVPYSCGAILFKNVDNYKVSQFRAPYLENNAGIKEKWELTLEGSRSGTGACATWLSAKSIGLDENGYGRILEKGIFARKQMNQKLSEIKNCQVIDVSDTNIVTFFISKEDDSLKMINRNTENLLEKLDKNSTYRVSKTSLLISTYEQLIIKVMGRTNTKIDDDRLVVIRCVFMNPFVTSKESNVSIVNDFSMNVQQLLK